MPLKKSLILLLLNFLAVSARILCLECWHAEADEAFHPESPPLEQWPNCDKQEQIRECIADFAAHECFRFENKKEHVLAKGCALPHIIKKYKEECTHKGWNCRFCRTHLCNSAEATKTPKLLIISLLALIVQINFT